MRKVRTASVFAVMALTASVSACVSADDVTVRTSVGSGEITFTETDEAADIDIEELTGYVTGTIKNLDGLKELHGFADVSADISLKADENTEMPVKVNMTGTLSKDGSCSYMDAHYSYDVMGNTGEDSREVYTWEEEGVTYMARSGSDGWKVSASGKFDDFTSSLKYALDEHEMDSFVLSGLLPNMYELDGKKYYICVYDADTMLDEADKLEAAAAYTGMFGDTLKENGAKAVIAIDAGSWLPRAVSFDASGASGSLPGFMFDSENDISFTANDLYATLLLEASTDAVEIPEEVLNTAVSEDDSFDPSQVFTGLGSLGFGEG